MGYQLMTTEDPKTEIEVPRSGTPAPEANARRWTLRRISGLVVARAGVGTVLAGLTGYWTTYRTVTRELLAPVKPGPTAPPEAVRHGSYDAGRSRRGPICRALCRQAPSAYLARLFRADPCDRILKFWVESGRRRRNAGKAREVDPVFAGEL